MHKRQSTKDGRIFLKIMTDCISDIGVHIKERNLIKVEQLSKSVKWQTYVDVSIK